MTKVASCPLGVVTSFLLSSAPTLNLNQERKLLTNQCVTICHLFSDFYLSHLQSGRAKKENAKSVMPPLKTKLNPSVMLVLVNGASQPCIFLFASSSQLCFQIAFLSPHLEFMFTFVCPWAGEGPGKSEKS